MKVSVLIPAYNEADRIVNTIQAVQEIEAVTEVIVVDDGSQDQTAQVSFRAGAEVKCNQFNQGKGAALNQGLEYLTNQIVLLLDADLQATACRADKLLTPILNKQADMTIAQFTSNSSEQGGFGLAKKLAAFGIQQLTGRKFEAPLSGQRAVKKEVLADIGEFAAGYGVETALTIDVWRAGYEIQEVPVDMEHRTTGKDLAGFYHRGRQFKDILHVLMTRLGSG